MQPHFLNCHCQVFFSASSRTCFFCIISWTPEDWGLTHVNTVCIFHVYAGNLQTFQMGTGISYSVLGSGDEGRGRSWWRLRHGKTLAALRKEGPAWRAPRPPSCSGLLKTFCSLSSGGLLSLQCSGDTCSVVLSGTSTCLLQGSHSLSFL